MASVPLACDSGGGDTIVQQVSGCIGNEQCADGNVCTADRCESGVCSNPELTNGTVCGDEAACLSPKFPA